MPVLLLVWFLTAGIYPVSANGLISIFCLVCCVLLWCGFISMCIFFLSFFIVWKFKLWKKGGRIGWCLMCSMFCTLLVLCFIVQIGLSYFLHLFWVLWYVFVDFSIRTLVAACRNLDSLNFFRIQLSHFFILENKTLLQR